MSCDVGQVVVTWLAEGIAWQGNEMKDLSRNLYERLRHRLVGGVWVPGERLPSVRSLAVREGISVHAVVSAYARLVQDGMLEAHQGKGYFVASRLGEGADEGMGALVDSGTTIPDPLFRMLQAGPQSIRLGCGWLPLDWRDTEGLARAVRRTARLSHRGLVEYGDIQGHLPLRRQLGVHLRRTTRIDVPPRQLLTTLGATQALDLVARLLISTGDVVLVDEPCSATLTRLLSLQGGRVVGVPRRLDGPDIGALDELLARHRPKAFFCNSTYHNPTGAGVSSQVGFKLLRRAITHGFVLVEDDVYGDFHPGVRPTLAEMDEFEHTIYIGSFAKSLSASLRIGYLAASAERLAQLAELKLLTSVAVPGFCERFVHTILMDGTYRRHVQGIQRRLMSQQVMAQRALKRRGWVFDIEPEGGMFLWGGHPAVQDLSAFIERLGQQGILLLPGRSFAVSAAFDHLTRINVAHLTRAILPALQVAQGNSRAEPSKRGTPAGMS